MKTIWLVKQESNVDGQILFNVVQCASEEKAAQVMNEEIDTLLREGHYTSLCERPEDFFVEQAAHRFFIMDSCDDYHEEITIEEETIQY